MYDSLSFVRCVSRIGTLLYTKFCGRLVGRDEFENSYYVSKRAALTGQPRRWVIYAAEPEASLVPARWFRWLHFQSNDLPSENGYPVYCWSKPHIPNLTGSNAAYLPDGHMLNSVGKCDSDSACESGSGSYRRWVP